MSGGRQRALFIGVDDYAFAPLSSCVNDAVAMRDAVIRLGIFDDSALEQPVMADAVAALARRALALGTTTHWAVARYQALATDAVFNAIRLPIPDHHVAPGG